MPYHYHTHRRGDAASDRWTCRCNASACPSSSASASCSSASASADVGLSLPSACTQGLLCTSLYAQRRMPNQGPKLAYLAGAEKSSAVMDNHVSMM